MPGPGTFLGRRDEHQLRLSRMEHQEIGIAADLVLQVGPLLPRLAAVAAHVDPDARRDVHLVGVQRIDHRAVHVVVHPRDHLERVPRIRALQEAALLHPDEQGVGILRMKGDVLRVGDVGRGGESPPGHVHRSQGDKLGPATPEIIAAVEVRGLRPGEDAHAAGPPDALETVDVVLREPLVSPLPALAPIGAREDRAVVRPGEDRAALRLDQEGVDVLVGQRAVSDVPARAARIALHARHAFDRADQHLPGGRRRTMDRGPAMREGYGHGCLLFSWIAGSERRNSPVSPGVSRSAHRRVPGYYRASRQRLVRPAVRRGGGCLRTAAQLKLRPSRRPRPGRGRPDTVCAGQVPDSRLRAFPLRPFADTDGRCKHSRGRLRSGERSHQLRREAPSAGSACSAAFSASRARTGSGSGTIAATTRVARDSCPRSGR